VKYLAIHHTAVKATGSQLNAVNEYHRGKWNMKSSLGYFVGYNYFLDYDGTITNTRRVGEETIANIGHNCSGSSDCDTISICFAGDFDNGLPVPAQIAAFRDFFLGILLKYPSIQVVGHRDLQAGRTCPGHLMTQPYIDTVLLQKKLYPDHADKEKKEKIALLMKKVSLLQTLLALLKRK